MALAIALAGQQPVPIGRSCALTFDQTQSLSVIGTLARRVPYRRILVLNNVTMCLRESIQIILFGISPSAD
jgi:hypothetical protein